MEAIKRFFGYLLITGGTGLLVFTIIGIVIIAAVTALIVLALLAGLSSM